MQRVVDMVWYHRKSIASDMCTSYLIILPSSSMITHISLLIISLFLIWLKKKRDHALMSEIDVTDIDGASIIFR